ELGPDDATHDRAEQQLAAVVGGEVVTAELAIDQPGPDQERQHHRDPESGDLDRAEAELECVGEGHAIGSPVISPGSGRESVAARVLSSRSPCNRRQLPAAPIIAAVSVLSRGDATLTLRPSGAAARIACARVRLQATPPPSTTVLRPSSRAASRVLATSTSITASWKPRARWTRSASRSVDCCTARSTAVLRPLNEKFQRSRSCAPLRSGRGKLKRR